MAKLPIGYLSCRSCGSIENCADLGSGLCPSCTQERAAYLAALQQRYEDTLSVGDAGTSAEVADLIRD